MKPEQIVRGHLMRKESAESLAVFCASASQDLTAQVARHGIGNAKAIYTIARGSSDAAANILSYEFMREMGVPVTSLPPSVFSLGRGVKVDRAAVLVISQSGASDDLVHSAKGAASKGAKVIAITNQPNSPVEKAATLAIPIGAGPELAVPATKTVIGSVAAGMALLSTLVPSYGLRAKNAVENLSHISQVHPKANELRASLLRARHVYVIGRDTGYGAAHEVALKLKECCAIHAEAYSASEVLHGPLQLATNPLMVLILDTGADDIQASLDQAQARFRGVGCDVQRINPADMDARELTPAAAAALMLAVMYPVILETALALGLNPDAPETLSKVTKTT
jgi:glucosamine--fructose-6-phosphate aminotransferase (isomerizing)